MFVYIALIIHIIVRIENIINAFDSMLQYLQHIREIEYVEINIHIIGTYFKKFFTKLNIKTARRPVVFRYKISRIVVIFPIINSFTDSVSEISNHSQNDLIEIPLKIGNVSLPFKLSKTNLSKLRKIPESLTRVIIRSKINTNNKTILVHNVTTERFSDFYLKIPDFPLNIVKYDQEFEIDPLFQKTSAKFDEGGAHGLLLNNLSIDNDV